MGERRLLPTAASTLFGYSLPNVLVNGVFARFMVQYVRRIFVPTPCTDSKILAFVDAGSSLLATSRFAHLLGSLDPLDGYANAVLCTGEIPSQTNSLIFHAISGDDFLRHGAWCRFKALVANSPSTTFLYAGYSLPVYAAKDPDLWPVVVTNFNIQWLEEHFDQLLGEAFAFLLDGDELEIPPELEPRIKAITKDYAEKGLDIIDCLSLMAGIR
jgi:hypothetical protein